MRHLWSEKRTLRMVHGYRSVALAGLIGAAGCVTSLLWSCSGSFSLDGALGITGGGQQDIAAARRAIEQGDIPDPDSITVEGFLSEHSIPVTEPNGAGDLFATAAVAWNKPFDAFTPLATLQIGFGTTLDAESFTRQPLHVVVVVDRSGSMLDPIDERSRTSKLDAVKIAIDRLLANLDDGDLISIVTFNADSATELEAAAGDDIAAVKTALDNIEAEGATDLAAGMRSAYRVASRQQDQARSDRLIVFTDVLLTVRADRQADDLIATMEEYAADDIGATLFGVGTDFGHETADRIAQVRGANYFFLSDYDRIVSVFDEEFDLLVTPAAYDITLSVTVPFEFDVEGVYGIPEPDDLGHQLDLELPTLFLSNRQGGGAAIVRLRAGALVDFDADNTVAQIDLTYKASDGQTKTQATIEAELPAGSSPDGSTPYFETEHAQRALLLLDTALVLKAACEDAYATYWWDDTQRSRAADRLNDFLPYFDDLAENLADSESETSRTLSQERDLVERLLSNIDNGGGGF